MHKPPNPEIEPKDDVLTPEDDDEAWLERAESAAEIVADWEREDD